MLPVETGMPSEEATIARLEVLVQRLLDAELLVNGQGAALLDEASGARRLWESGHTAEARPSVERIVLFTEALIQTGALMPDDGRDVIQSARAILDGSTKTSRE
jgi:hypothetical protein